MLAPALKNLQTSDFDFDLPPHLIAQSPSSVRDASRLLVVTEHALRHHHFAVLPDLLLKHVGPNTLLVFNDTKVIPARLYGHKIQTQEEGGQTKLRGKVELLLCDPLSAQPATASEGTWKEVWRCLCRGSKSMRPGSEILLHGDSPMVAKILANEGEGKVQVEFSGSSTEDFFTQLSRLGQIPLPPYIKRPSSTTSLIDDKDRYQTVYATKPGAVAAPTAGLHFTEALLKELSHRGFPMAFVTLHVGPGTFAPIKTEEVRNHVIHRERYHIPEATTQAIAQAKADGRKVLAVGTTVVRALESATKMGAHVPDAGFAETQIFIYPPYQFRCVDAMITNFHLPKSTLLMLVSAFAGRLRMLATYQEAIQREYRFFSYGDAMLLTKSMSDLENL